MHTEYKIMNEMRCWFAIDNISLTASHHVQHGSICISHWTTTMESSATHPPNSSLPLFILYMLNISFSCTVRWTELLSSPLNTAGTLCIKIVWFSYCLLFTTWVQVIKIKVVDWCVNGEGKRGNFHILKKRLFTFSLLIFYYHGTFYDKNYITLHIISIKKNQSQRKGRERDKGVAKWNPP